jgi:hypothetical protein
VEREVEAGDRVAADRERAEHGVEDFGAGRIAIAVLDGIEHFVSEDGHGFGHVAL